MTWKDTTSYSRMDDRVPTTWTAVFGVFGVTVTSSHIDYRGEWVARAEPLFGVRELKVTSKEDAQTKALAMVEKVLRTALEDLGKVQS